MKLLRVLVVVDKELLERLALGRSVLDDETMLGELVEGRSLFVAKGREATVVGRVKGTATSHHSVGIGSETGRATRRRR